MLSLLYNLMLPNFFIYMVFLVIYFLKFKFKLSLLMMAMTLLIFKIVKFSNNVFNYYTNNFKNLFFLMLLFFLLMFFCMNELIYFYMVFELCSLMIFFSLIITSKNLERMKASLYFFSFMGIGTFPFFLLIYYINQEMSMIFFIFSFCLKLPIFLFHLWLPKAHVEANYYDSMILASLLLKMGGYGMMSMNHNYMLMMYLNLWCISIMTLISLYVIFIPDLKMVLAYSSVLHMMGMMLFFFSNSFMMEEMILINMLNHAFLSSTMFFIMGLLYNFTKSRLTYMNKSMMVNNYFIFMYFMISLFLNMGFPPFMSLFSEIFMYSSMLNFSNILWIFIMILMFFMMMFNLNIINIIANSINFKFFTHNKLILSSHILLMEHLYLMVILL